MIPDPKSREYLQYLSLGLEIAAGLSIPLFIGYWADSRWDTSPWFLLLGAVAGIAIMIGIMLRLMRKTSGGR